MSRKQYPSIDYLRQCVREENGKLFWVNRPLEHFKSSRTWKMWNTSWPGKEAGSPHESSEGVRWRFTLDQVHIYRYQAIWALRRGEWVEMIDHRSGDTLDDRLENLRPADDAGNSANQKIRINNTSGYKGVSWNRSLKKWSAHIKVNYKSKYLGSFDDPAEAHAAYVKAAQRYFGEFACDGRNLPNQGQS